MCEGNNQHATDYDISRVTEATEKGICSLDRKFDGNTMQASQIDYRDSSERKQRAFAFLTFKNEKRVGKQNVWQ